MEINLDLSKLITNEEKVLLKNILNKGTSEFTDIIEGVCMAAIAEYFEMMLGKQVPTRANEIQERRLFHLLKHYFDGRIPSESEISAIFQLTESGSRSLLRNVRTRFKFDLKEEMEYTIKNTLLQAVSANDSYRVVIQSDNILEELRQVVSMKGAKLEQISKVKGSAGLYNIPEDTFDLLCANYNISRAQLEAAMADI
ncbi:hypothetical protein [Sporosarcina koreensis]|uniref:Uncharacterized protein n=1 Tax=Sporosarcina koreensis TaxID=334735 RepID=A0ABW0U3K0_9BACL